MRTSPVLKHSFLYSALLGAAEVTIGYDVHPHNGNVQGFIKAGQLTHKFVVPVSREEAGVTLTEKEIDRLAGVISDVTCFLKGFRAAKPDENETDFIDLRVLGDFNAYLKEAGHIIRKLAMPQPEAGYAEKTQAAASPLQDAVERGAGPTNLHDVVRRVEEKLHSKRMTHYVNLDPQDLQTLLSALHRSVL